MDHSKTVLEAMISPVVGIGSHNVPINQVYFNSNEAASKAD